MANIFVTTLKVLKLPVKLLVGWVKGKKQVKVKNERKKKQLAHVRNFSVRHYGWQQTSDKKSRKKGFKKKLTNNSSRNLNY